MKKALIIFTKEPVLGKVKTRLATSIGEREALKIYTLLLGQLLNIQIQNDVFIAVEPYTKEYEKHFGKHKIFLQEGKNIGQKMSNAFLHLFEKGYEQVVLVGADIPHLDKEIIKEAFESLETYDAVLNPTKDKGYYLIGFNKKSFQKEAFLIDFSHDVYEQTVQALQPLHVKQGKELFDIDEIEDLRTFVHSTCKETKLLLHVKSLLTSFPKISVIIPVYYESKTLPKTIQVLRQNAKEKNYEIIVCDTPNDTTIHQIDTSYFRPCFAPKAGRATQLNCGAKLARGEILLFLHADTLLPKNWDELITLHVNNSYDVGAFKLAIETQKKWLRFIAFCTNVRAFITKTPYGDQGQFFSAKLFYHINGYDEIALMEDVSIMKKIKKQNIALKIINQKVLTSQRRWLKEGIFYTTFRNRILSTLYAFGVKPEKLANFYKWFKN